jgi:hypothetical protein
MEPQAPSRRAWIIEGWGAMRRILVALCGVLAVGAVAVAVPAFAVSSNAVPACTASDLGVWVAISQGSAAAGSVFYPLQFTNLSGHACSLDGYPGVSVLSRGGTEQGSPASRYPQGTPRPVVVAAGATAHAQFIWSDGAVYTSPHCDPTSDVETLRVYPPGQRSSTLAMFSLEACSRPGATFMSVGPVEPGPGTFSG